MIDILKRNPLLLGLALLAAVLAAVLAVEMRLPSSASRDAPPKGARPVEAKLLPPIAARPPEQAYPEVTARPLFVSTRRPAPEQAAVQAPTMPRGQFTLQGVIVHGEQRTALLRERASGRVHRAAAGEEVGGVKVVKIDPESVTLGLNDERETVNLIVQKGPGGPAVVAAGGQVPGAPGAGPFSGVNPFARPGAPGTPGAPPANVQAGAGMQPVPVQQGAAAVPVPGTPGFGPPVSNTQPGAPNVAATPTTPPGPQTGPAFPMSPEELLARRRARRAQQNQ